MIYVRSKQGPRDLSVGMARIFATTGLIAYPVGALVLALGPDTLATELSGYALILLALLTCAALVGTTLQRVVGEDVKMLDEFELRLRGRALSVSYLIFSALTLLLVLYAAIATDNTLWRPNTYNGFNGLFWGVFLYSSVLPTAVVSWMVDPSFASDDA